MPALDAAQRAQSAALRKVLAERIEAGGGWIPFDEYLDLLLYAPGLGYYSAGAAKLGAAGDFTTAPELSGLFGACIARQCAPLLRGGGEVLELGAGSGALAEVLLARLAALGVAPDHYFILETSADLRQRQQQRLGQLPPELHSRLRWLDRLPAGGLRGLILANEVADALPFQCFAVTADGFAERGVALDAQGELGWKERPAAAALRAELAKLASMLGQPLLPGYRSELCLRLGPWIGGLSAALDQGWLLLFDYGLGQSELYHPQRVTGTLRCHYRHRAHDDPFLYPGLQDVTAWVDFTRLAEAAADAGLTVAGYCTQAAFLLGAGIDAELEAAGSSVERAQRASEARQLLMPGEMGESFKAMALTRGAVEDPTAFGLQDLRRLL
ncbi:MAG TPA: SAM-dependent methyltransferase [Steroidobacteraceae bacterium]|nr:SAM-dependent methyltransferase [Steroidobacteraceae bacterium]